MLHIVNKSMGQSRVLFRSGIGSFAIGREPGFFLEQAKLTTDVPLFATNSLPFILKFTAYTGVYECDALVPYYCR
jgi:hypothetical protein